AMMFSEETDLLLAVGTSFSEAATHAWDPRLVKDKKLIQIDIDPREMGKNYPLQVGVVGDAKQVMTELNYQIERDNQWLDAAIDYGKRLSQVRALKAQHPRFINPEAMEDESVPLKPQRVIAEMRQALPDDAILFVDIGNVMAWALH